MHGCMYIRSKADRSQLCSRMSGRREAVQGGGGVWETSAECGRGRPELRFIPDPVTARLLVLSGFVSNQQQAPPLSQVCHLFPQV